MRLLDLLVDYIREHPYEAMAVVIVLYIFIVITILPVTPVHLMVAYAYCKVYNSFWIGFAVATVIIFIGSLLGAILAILLARYVIADFIKTRLNKSKSVGARKFRIVDKMFVTNGICLVTLLRLMFIPFGLASYALGVTAVSLCDYILGTLVYIVKIALIVIVGCTIWQASEESKESGKGKMSTEEIVIIVVEVVVTIIITVWLTIWAKNKFEREFDKVEKEEEI